MSSTSVVILNYNGQKFLEQFLPSVIQHSRNYEIIVADNCSTDLSVSFIQEHYPDIQLIQIPENRGYSSGYNYALKQIHTEYYILLNSDVEVSKNWITPIIELMAKDPEIAAAQPKILSFHDRRKFEHAGAAGGFIDTLGYPFCRGRIFNTVENDNGQYDDEQTIFWATGACLFIRSSVFHELDGFDDDFFAHMEEIDLCWKINNIGLKTIYNPTSVVYHVGGGTLQKSNPKKTYLNFRNGLSLIYKNYSTSDLIIKFPLRIVLDWVAAFQMLSHSPRDFISILRAHWDFIKLLPANTKKRIAHKKKKKNTRIIPQVLNKSIIWEYFIKKRSKFSDLHF
ncbi:MAG: glycosyltransferase family 2 protein [Cyclobacteriaceae bacterium]|nr:glycosyltransferase family 2 protein [Cyclobacteriaceae bacterium]